MGRNTDGIKFFAHMQYVQENVNNLAGAEASHSEPQKKTKCSLLRMYILSIVSLHFLLSCLRPQKRSHLSELLRHTNITFFHSPEVKDSATS